MSVNMDKEAQRAALESIRKDANDPTLSVGDIVFSGGFYAAVTEIKTYAPGAHRDSPIRNDWTAVQVKTDMGTSRWHGREPEAPTPHIHVGSNIPGFLPESDVMCFDSVEDALEALRHEIDDQQDYYWDQCSDGTPEGCECAWCSVAGDCEAALSAIADGDAAYAVNNGTGRLHVFSPPEGPDVAHWAEIIDGNRDDCEIFAEQEA